MIDTLISNRVVQHNLCFDAATGVPLTTRGVSKWTRRAQAGARRLRGQGCGDDRVRGNGAGRSLGGERAGCSPTRRAESDVDANCSGVTCCRWIDRGSAPIPPRWSLATTSTFGNAPPVLG